MRSTCKKSPLDLTRPEPSSCPPTPRWLRDQLATVENEIANLTVLIRRAERDRLAEAETSATGTVKPLSPEQVRKRAERDRERQERIRTIQASATRRITDIEKKLGR